MNTPFEKAISRLEIRRFPEDKTLMAWNSADSYLYNQLREDYSLTELTNQKILLIGEEFSIPAILLQAYQPSLVSDSIFSKISTQKNLVNNQLSSESVQHLSMVEFLEQPQNLARFDIVLCKIPKSFDFFKQILSSFYNFTKPSTAFYFSGMVKYLSSNTRSTLEAFFQEVHIQKTVKKALLFKAKNTQINVKPTNTVQSFQLENLGEFKAYTNTFCQGSLDKGTRLLLENTKTNSLKGVGVDLGCGYGVISRFVLDNQPEVTQLQCIDISELSIASTKLNTQSSNVEVQYLQQDGLASTKLASLDFVISNPPIHSQNSLSVNQSLRLFRQVQKALKIGGKLYLVANKGLNYQPFLEKLFDNAKLVTQNKSYSIFECTK
ncbi:methyltransferase [Fibrobacterales bacterium]|nr:methyltransferase [Fibrobacterales bacterium]